MPKYNRAEMRDKIYACWMGKNIGGTLGTPYEGQQKINDIKGFATEPGEALVNDDLDLQLVWLRAVEQHGYRAINERLLGEYWLTYNSPLERVRRMQEQFARRIYASSFGRGHQ